MLGIYCQTIVYRNLHDCSPVDNFVAKLLLG